MKPVLYTPFYLSFFHLSISYFSQAQMGNSLHTYYLKMQPRLFASQKLVSNQNLLILPLLRYSFYNRLYFLLLRLKDYCRHNFSMFLICCKPSFIAEAPFSTFWVGSPPPRVREREIGHVGMIWGKILWNPIVFRVR